MAYDKILKLLFMLAIAIFFAFVLSSMAMIYVMPFIPLDSRDTFAILIVVIVTIAVIGLVGPIVWRLL